MKPELLIKTERGSKGECYTEKLHYGCILVIDEEFQTIARCGDDKNTPFPFRSSAKPLQATVLIDSGADRHFALTSEELAIICASHAGSAKHIKLIEGILAKAGLTPEHLQCGFHTPLDKEEADRLVRAMENAHNMHNNCSGKHAGMLATCAKMQHMGWNADTYLQTDHPLQKAIMLNIKTLCMLDAIPPTVSDGCAAPIPVLPLRNMGIGYLNLLNNDKYRELTRAMTQHPYVAGGKGRLDSEIMQAGGGNLVAKVGADGLCVVMNIREKKALIVKMTDADMKARSIVTVEAIKQLCWLTENEIAAAEGLLPHYDREIKNLRGESAGQITTLLELDI